MKSLKLNKKRGLLAVVMALAMMFAGAVFVADEVDAAAKTTYISGEINSTQVFDANTIVVVNGDLDVIAGAELNIEAGAQFTVNDGVTLTVAGTGLDEENATMNISKDAYVNINGTLTIGEFGVVTVKSGVPEDDTLKDHGFYVNGSVNVTKGGSFTTDAFDVEQYIQNCLETSSGVFFKDGSTLSVTSSGTKISKIGGYITLMDGATFKMAGITEVGLVVISADSNTLADVDKKTVNLPAAINIKPNESATGMTSGKVSNYTISASVTTENAYIYNSSSEWISEYSIKAKVASLDISGTVQNGDVVETYAISADDVLAAAVAGTIHRIPITDGGNLIVADKDGKPKAVAAEVTVSDALAIGKTGMFAGDYGALVISGTLAVNDEAEVALYDADVMITGKVNLDGASLYQGEVANSDVVIDGGVVEIRNADDELYTINSFYGAMYTVTSLENADPVVYLCDLEVAIAAATENTDIDSVYVFAERDSENNYDNDYDGGYVVNESFDVPADLTLYVSNALIVGEDIIINVPETAAVVEYIPGAVIVVEGKIIDKSLTLTVADEGLVVCQVLQTTDEGATQIFTSLRLALKDAVAGDVIELVGDVDIEGTLQIPVEVTVEIDDSSILVKQGAQLVVDGILDITGVGNLATESETNDGKKAGIVVVNNYIIGTGAYNVQENESTDVTTGFNVSGIYTTAKVDDEEGSYIMSIPAFEKYSMYADDSQFQGVLKYNDNITLAEGEEDATLDIAGELDLGGTLTLVGYSITIGVDGTFTGIVSSTNGAVKLNKITASSGDVIISNYVNDDPVADDLTIAGIPGTYMDETTGKNVASMDIDSGNVVVSESFDASNLKSFGIGASTTMTVNSSFTTGELIIDGDVSVTKDGEITVTKNMTLNGSIVIDDDATVQVTESIYVGTNAKSLGLTTSNVATIVGKVISSETIYVAAGSSVDEKTTDGLSSVEFVVEDALWIVAYAADKTTIGLPNATVEDAKFNGWVDDKDKPVTAITEKIDKLVAKIDYNIYSVNIVADNGVGTVAIDGIVLKKIGNTFSASNLVAGEHTISYELKNGYEGTVKMTVDGKSVDGYKFTLSGTDADDLFVDINLSGTTQIEYTTATDSGEDGGMSLVEILLIVLVVLVVILAVIVALRMMRS